VWSEPKISNRPANAPTQIMTSAFLRPPSLSDKSPMHGFDTIAPTPNIIVIDPATVIEKTVALDH